ncbi:MAG: alpha/beta fold hydrolase [Leptospiraceae bacterium]|nr:alpha/beta fold hydrolase [Leptospiraceae bacterium]MCP5499464.1 alpha/beta fold hydrolase [Leptospiraceae bacterium]
MELFCREIGDEKSPGLIVLHGLFGSSRNWISNAKALSNHFRVYSPDLRNHGESPHDISHRLEDMVLDLKEFFSQKKLLRASLIGHSMGGLVSILFANQFPTLIDKLVIVDIAPKSYSLDYSSEFTALSMDVSQYHSREALDKDMSKVLSSEFIRKFLQMNLEKVSRGYRWKINVDAIRNTPDRFIFPELSEPYFSGRSLFVLGEKSFFVEENDKQNIKRYFPNVEIQTIPGAEHYLHYSHSSEFLQIVEDFLLK